MPIECACPACGALLRVPDSSVGKTGRCPKCEERFTATEDAAQEPEEPRRSPRPDEYEGEEDDRPSRRPARREEGYRRDDYRPPAKPASVQNAGILLLVGGIVSL